jgi:hypothetical protein
VNVFAIGIGDWIDEDQLKSITSKNRFVDLVPSFSVLLNSVKEFSTHVCFLPITIAPLSVVVSTISASSYKYYDTEVGSIGATI